MDTERRLERAVERRTEEMRSGLDSYLKGEITSQKFYGILRAKSHLSEGLSEADYDYTYRNALVSAAAKIRAEAKGVKLETEYDRAAKALRMPADSRTVRQYVSGEIDLEEALRRAEIIRYRHERTEYDALLEAGYSKEQAREIIGGR